MKPYFNEWFSQESVKALIASIILTIALFLAFFPLFNGRIIFEDDVTNYYIPAFKFYSNAVKNNESIALTPTIFSGFPLPLTQAGGFYDPLNWLLFKTVSYPTSYHGRIALNYFLGGLFIYAFARSLRLSFLSSIVAMFAYITAQHIIPGANILRSNSYFLMPGLFLAAHLIWLRAQEHWSKLLMPIVFAITIFCISILGGYTQLNLYGLVAVGFFSLFLLYKDFSWRFVWAITFAGLIAIAALLPYFISVMELVSVSYRAGGLSWHDASANIGVADYARNLTTGLFLPPSKGTLQSLYIGIVGIIGFCIALFTIRKDMYAAFFSGLFAFSIIAAFPYPLFWLMHHLPVFELFRFPPHWFFVTSFSMSILAAIGIDHASRQSSARGIARSVYTFLQSRNGIGIVIAILTLNFVLPMRYVIAHQSISTELLSYTPFVVEKIREEEQFVKAQPFRTYQPYASDMSWFSFLARAPLIPKEISYLFGREFTQTHLTPLFWDIDTVRGFDNLVPSRYDKVLKFLEKQPFSEATHPQAFTHVEEVRLSLPDGTFSLLGMMNVKYVWTIFPLSEEYLNEEVTFIDKRNFLSFPIPIHLYRNNAFVPRIYAPPSITLVPSDVDPFVEIVERPHDFSSMGFIECDCSDENASQGAVKIAAQSHKNNAVIFDAIVTADAWILVSNSMIPGWRAAIDGVETQIYTANYLFQAIRVPSGEHTVSFEYRDVALDLFR